VAWVAALTGVPADVIAIDGKTLSFLASLVADLICSRDSPDTHGLFGFRIPPGEC